MNKQEVIDELENAIPDFILNDFQRGKETGLTYALELVNQLDELEKPVVPQYVADWYEKNEYSLERNIYTLCIRSYQRELPKEEFSKWFDDVRNKAIETLVKMKLYGYEVEKEKLYTVEIPNPNSIGGKLVLFKQQSTGRLILDMLNPNINKPKYIHLTEPEIKKDFEWAWQFAKDVEK